MKPAKLILLAAVALAVGLFLAFDLQGFLSLEFLQAQRSRAVALHLANPWTTAALYSAAYIAVTGLSLPGAAIMTLAAGAIFGLGLGVLMVSFASTLGATLAFALTRHLFRDLVQKRFAERLAPINKGIAKDGAFYLFALRLAPALPFFAINLGMALTTIKTWTFYWVSQLGMLAGTIVYVNAGRELGRLDSLAGILSPTLLLSFTLLGLFPLLARKALAYLAPRFGKRPTPADAGVKDR